MTENPVGSSGIFGGRGSYNGSMDTILYLMLEKKKDQDACFPPFFHIRRVKEEMREDCEFLAVTVPRALLDPWELGGYLAPFLKFRSSVDTVYDPALENWLTGRKLAGWWRKNWPYPDFADFHRADYAAFLWKQAVQAGGGTQYVFVLGFEDFVPGLLAPCLRNLKSLCFVVDEMCGPLESFMEDAYEEYGLAVTCDAGRGWRPLRCGFPALVLDLSGEVKSAAAELSAGSVWLDLDAMEGKRRRLENRPGVRYFSIRKEWERMGRRAEEGVFLNPQILDTIGKSGYNT